MKPARMTFLLTLVTCAAVAAASGVAGAQDTAVAVVSSDVDAYESIAARVERGTGIAYDDALASLNDSKVIGDFVLGHWYSDEVGAVWVTYEDGYRVHARQIKTPSPELDAFEKALGRPIVRHSGGASLGALNRASDYIERVAPETQYKLNVQEGYVDFIGTDILELPSEIVSAEYVRTGAKAPVEGGQVAVVHAGMGWEIDSTNYCTTGFTYRVGTTGTHGNAVAAHCWDGFHYSVTLTADNWGNSYSSSNNYESCSTRDYQRQTIGNNAGVDYLVYWWGYDDFGVINGVAGGYYIGQLATKVGETSGSLSGTVQGFANYNRPGGADCPNTGTVHGIHTNIPSQPGDSGGPTILHYNQSNYLATITSFTDFVNWTVGAWIPYLPLPTGAHICVQSNPCS